MHSFILIYHINYGDGTKTKTRSTAEAYQGETLTDAWQEFLSTRKWYTPEEAAKIFFLEDWKIIT